MKPIIPIAITMLVLTSLMAGCLGNSEPEKLDAQDFDPSLKEETSAPHQSVVVFDEMVETFPGLAQGDTWTFMVPQGATMLELDMVERESITVGDFKISVEDSNGTEIVLLDAVGVRFGTEGSMQGFIQNGAIWKNPQPGTWAMHVESDGRFQQHVIVTATVPVINVGSAIGPSSSSNAARWTPQGGESAASSPIYDGVVEAGPGLSTLATEKFKVSNSYDSLRVSIVPLEGLSVGSWELKVRSPSGAEWVVLEESGLRFGQATAAGGEATNNGVSIVAEKGESLERGEWRLRVEATGSFQLHVIVTAD